MKKRAFLVVRWLRVHFEMQGTLVRSLVWEDPNVPQGNQALAPQLTEAQAPRACALKQEQSPKWEARTTVKISPRSLQLEKACLQQ